ncbi:MAG: hypothetical protein HY298_15875 [Verrucomicrobia bacterium]|nr:hypothetical protein [Verrucomicrobiota bacterium]
MIIRFVAQKIRESSHWCWVANSIWSPEIQLAIESILQDNIGKFGQDFSENAPRCLHDVEEVLTRIPPSAAEELLEKYWIHFGKTRYFVTCALRVGTPKCRELASQSINACPKEINLLRFVYMHMGRRLGEDDNPVFRSALLTSLEPHLDRLGQEDIRGFYYEMKRGADYEWYKTFLSGRLSPEQHAHLFPKDEDLATELTGLEQPNRIPRYWLEELEQRRVPVERIWPILEKWFMSTPSTKRAEIVFEIIEVAGTRRELALLERVSKLLNTTENNRAIANVSFSVRLRTLL